MEEAIKNAKLALVSEIQRKIDTLDEYAPTKELYNLARAISLLEGTYYQGVLCETITPFEQE